MVRARTEALGAAGAAWRSGLPDLLRSLADEWHLVLGAPIAGGTAAYVVRARTAQGADVVLKVPVPEEPSDAHLRVRVLSAAAGIGYVELLELHHASGAHLLEGLGTSLADSGRRPEQQLDTLAALLPLAWGVPKPADVTVAPEEEKAAAVGRFVARMWEQLGRPCPAGVRDRALRYAARRAAAFDLGRCVLVHGDPHPANALRVRRARPGTAAGYVFVDPDGFLADPAYDAGVALRDWSAQILRGADPAGLLRGYCRLLAGRTGLGEDAVWEWGYLERVSSGLHALELGAADMAGPLLFSATVLDRA
ncbi:MAG: phosphotransferase [Mycobacteriales bacterium]